MVIRGTIDRRLLVNYRVDPDVIAPLLPAGLSPKLARGYAIGGICLIRLKSIRPRLLPAACGFTSENAAHRIAVEWDRNGRRYEGVYIVRRDSNSLTNHLLGGRLFPGVHHRARFTVSETPERLSIQLESRDGQTRVAVAGRTAAAWPSDSVFSCMADASAFFEAGSIGYSPQAAGTQLDGVELRCQNWAVAPLEIERVESSYFDDRQRFPAESVRFDCALLMRGIEHEWRPCGDFCCDAGASEPKAKHSA